MSLVQIKDSKLVRDIHSKAVLNTDKNGLQDYLLKKEISKRQQKEQTETKQKLIQLEQDMSEIKKMLQEIAEMRKV
jgi:transposase